MRNQQKSHTMFDRKSLEQVEDLITILRIETAGRFIRQKKSGSVDQSPGNGNTLAFPATQGIGQMIRTLGKTNGIDQPLNFFQSFFFLHPDQLGGKLGVLKRSQSGQQVKGLKDIANGFPSQLLQFVPVQITKQTTGYSNLARINLLDSTYAIEQGRFPLPLGPIKATRSPDFNSRSTPRSTETPPKDLVTDESFRKSLGTQFH